MSIINTKNYKAIDCFCNKEEIESDVVEVGLKNGKWNSVLDFCEYYGFSRGYLWAVLKPEDDEDKTGKRIGRMNVELFSKMQEFGFRIYRTESNIRQLPIDIPIVEESLSYDDMELVGLFREASRIFESIAFYFENKNGGEQR